MPKALSGLFLLFALIASTCLAKVERSLEKSFPAQGIEKISVRSYGGDIEIRTVPGATSVSVVATQIIDAKTNQAADGIAAAHKLELTQNGNEIQARFGFGDKAGRWTGKGKQPMVVDFQITVPSSVSVELMTSGGGIEVGDLEGSVRAETNGGDIDLGSIGGPISVSTSGGDIALDGHRAEARLSTSGGDIDVSDSRAPLHASTSGGDITIDSAWSRVHAKTSGGDVKAHLQAPLTDSISLETSGGEIVVTFPRAAAFSLNASTSGGSIKSKELSIQTKRGALGKRSLEGDVNGGGQAVRLETRGGNIRLEYK